MAAIQFQQKCPFCPELLNFDAEFDAGTRNGKGGVDFTLTASTTPESTEHVWTHAPEGASA